MSTARATSLLATARKWRPALFRQPEVAAAADAPPRSLASALAETFEDGTTSGARTAAQYRRLCATVGRIIETDHHALAVRLQEAYRRHDPSAAPDAARRRRAAPEFSALLHAVARRAGFALCTAAHEDRASAEHFGPDMWNVPVATRWEEIDGSLVDARRGGFDAYAAEGAEAGRPTFAGKLLLYHRGEGEARKVGYFTAEKAEELLWRFCASVTAPLVRPAAARIERAYSAAEDGVRRARAIADQWAGPLLDGSAATPPAGAIAAAAAAPGTPPPTLPPPKSASVGESALGRLPLGWRDFFEQTTLVAPTFGHVLLAFRHKDADREARGNGEHVIVGLFRDVPQADLELLMPHTQVQMPPLQRASFALMAATGAFAGLPLLTHWGSDGANNWVQLVTLYAVAAVALRTSLRWRFSKQYYQQLLVSHQHSNRVGSADGALLYVARLAEEEQRTRAALALHALLDAQRRAGLHGGEAIELGAADLAAASERLLASSAALRDFGLAPHVSGHGALHELVRIGVVDQRGVGGGRRFALRPADEAIEAARRHWQAMGDAEELGDDVARRCGVG